MQELACKHVVTNEKFFYVARGFLFVGTNIDLSKQPVFHYLEYSCGKFSPSTFRTTLVDACIKYFILKNFGFNFRKTNFFSRHFLSANSSLFFNFKLSIIKSLSKHRPKKHFSFTHDERIAASFLSRETMFLDSS